MTRFAIDAATALRIVREGVDVGEHQLVGVAGLRSQAMRLLYAEARAGDVEQADVRGVLDGIVERMSWAQFVRALG